MPRRCWTAADWDPHLAPSRRQRACSEIGKAAQHPVAVLPSAGPMSSDPPNNTGAAARPAGQGLDAAVAASASASASTSAAAPAPGTPSSHAPAAAGGLHPAAAATAGLRTPSRSASPAATDTASSSPFRPESPLRSAGDPTSATAGEAADVVLRLVGGVGPHAAHTAPPDAQAAPGPTVEQLLRQVDRYREKLANGMREFKKLAEENERLRAEVRTLRTEQQRPAFRPGESPEEVAALRSRNQTLEKEIGQLRFNAKLKIKQLQKEIQSARGGSGASTPAIDISLGADGTDSVEHARIAELEETLQKSAEANDALTRQVHSLNDALLKAEEKAMADIAALQRQHAVELDAFQVRLSASQDRHEPPAISTARTPASADGLPDSSQLLSRVAALASNFAPHDETRSLDPKNPLAVLDLVTDYFANTSPRDPEAAQDQLVLLQSANNSLRNRLSGKADASPDGVDRQALFDRIAALEGQLAAVSGGPATTQSADDAAGQARSQPAGQPTAESDPARRLRAQLAEERARSLQLRNQLSEAQSRLSAAESGSEIGSARESEATQPVNSLVQELQRARDDAKAAADARAQLEIKIAELQELVAALQQANSSYEAAAGSGNLSAIEQRNFTLEEQLKDFRIQIANRNRELATAQETIAAKTAEYEKLQKEHEDRVRKLKGLLLAANKSITESKKLMGQREAETEELKSRLEASLAAEQELRERNDHLQKTVERMSSETLDDRDARQMQLQDLQKQLTAARAEAADVRAEFQSYKVRAAAALQKSSTSAVERRAADLEEIRVRLERETLDQQEQLAQAQTRFRALEVDLATALDQLAIADANIKRLERSDAEMQTLKLEVESLNRKLALEKQLHEQAITSLELSHATALEQLKAQASAAPSEQRPSSLASAANPSDAASSATIESEIIALKEQLARTLADLERHRKSSGHRDSISSDTSRSAGAAGGPAPATPTAITSAVLPTPLSRTMSAHSSHWGEAVPGLARNGSFSAHNAISSYKEKEYQLQIQQLQEVLTENEAEIERLHSQEKLLKEELRRIDRMEKRQDLSVEYLKNVVLSFIESDVKEPLVPIIAQILHLSPDEAQRVRKKVHRPEDDSIIPSFGFF
ncbi:hypothetical protein HK105_200687 [Polyrhizophydium stewartii]|uniref:GRIP domain-containing protein n=1 Tax=Polyrhizophydium stewartii TaxID=2732419 RepID=A0ABR4NJW6_9FUNG